MKRLYPFVILFIIGGCSTKTNLNHTQSQKLEFSELPVLIQAIFYEHLLDEKNSKYELLRMENSSDGGDESVYNLNPNDEDFEYSCDHGGPFAKPISFKHFGKNYVLPFNGNEINPPYVFIGDSLYFRISKNLLVNFGSHISEEKSNGSGFHYKNGEYGLILLKPH